ncbi:MAG TPA: hypothetical protein VEZ88_12075 [Steroidobacteraceae bacterium]|nr:hypothetical protein [Steroidobacteraceae bacterium]
MDRAPWYLVSMFVAVASLPVRVQADDKTGVDSDFLEFLGSLDSDDVAWSAYLSSADAPPAPKPSSTPAPQPAKPAEKAASEGESK